MTPHPTALLGLVLCLGPTIPAQRGHLHRPSISAKPGPVVRRGSSVTFVCRGPSSVDTFRLEKERGPFNETVCGKETPHNETEARFPIASASEHDAGRYRCIYLKRSVWSERSEFLELKVTDEGTTQGPPTSQALPSEIKRQLLAPSHRAEVSQCRQTPDPSSSPPGTPLARQACSLSTFTFSLGCPWPFCSASSSWASSSSTVSVAESAGPPAVRARSRSRRRGSAQVLMPYRERQVRPQRRDSLRTERRAPQFQLQETPRK
ncbi:leukocyte-associated immunoglobulin-like receptor 1 isoform X5 [Choloepus didactylus]|uniref:leukocyte-associated immunoglobulin-like receptor 1 isoform X5 n=1 Tax=Choloepus didactylus TaxID=27675 RepID=UPI00189E76BB|nr:leukocyte-associated immunoglobulin-like receptor 1 isoform X5 [Choloepus didactylus]